MDDGQAGIGRKAGSRPAQKKSRRSFGAGRAIARFLSVAVFLAILACAGILFSGLYFNSPPDTHPHAVQGDPNLRIEDDGSLFLEIGSGESAYSVGVRLEHADVIRTRYLWYALSRLGKNFIKAGAYRVELPVNQIKLHELLTEGRQMLVRVTVPEGVTPKKIAAILDNADVCSSDDFLAACSSREILNTYKIPGKDMTGYLFPDTYFFNLSFPAEKVVKIMADTFFSRLAAIAPVSSMMTPAEINEKVIIASIVEREYRVSEEAAPMAGVFYNRLKIGMALQSCATVEYLITEIQGKPHPEVLYNRDIEIENPYNTYRQRGLPPGPISEPGETALRAAFYPAKTDYLYFRLTDAGAGRHYFSKTLDDHIRAGALYVKAR